MKKNIWDRNWIKNEKLDIHHELLSIIEKYTMGKKILEVGYGSGGDLIVLSHKGYSCYGIDTSRVAYNRLKKYKKIHVYLQDGCKTSFKDHSFDLIYHQGLLEHFKKPEMLLSENKRILNNEGILIIDVPHKWNMYTFYRGILMLFRKWYGGWETSYSATSLKKLIISNGFKVEDIQYRGIFPHRWGKILFPQNIDNNKFKEIMSKPPLKYFQQIALLIYKKIKIIRLISSYNIIIIA